MNIFLVLNKNHRKYQFTCGIFRHVYYAIFNQCTKSKSKSVTYIHTVKSINHTVKSIEIILKRVYNDQLVQTKLKKTYLEKAPVRCMSKDCFFL